MTDQSPDQNQDNILHGIVNALLAFFFLSLMSAVAKILSQTHHIIEIAFYRNLVALIPVLFYLLVFRKTHLLKTGKPLLLVLRVLIGTGGLILTFAALKLLPLADATVIFFTSALLSPALAFFILKEHIGPHRWSAILFGLCGILLIAHPSGNVTIIGITIALCAATCHALIHLFLRSLKSEPALTITFYFFLGGVLIPAFFMPFMAKTPTPDEWLLFLSVGLSGGLGQYFLTKAFKLAPVPVIMPLTYTGLLWASILDIFIWNTVPGWPVFTGGAAIIGANLYILHREQKIKNRSKT